MPDEQIILYVEIPGDTAAPLQKAAAAYLQSELSKDPNLQEPEVSTSVERDGSLVALLVDTIAQHGPTVVTVAGGITTVLKAIEAGLDLLKRMKSDDEALTPEQELLASLNIDNVLVQRPDQSFVPARSLLPDSSS